MHQNTCLESSVFFDNILAWGRNNQRVFPWREESDGFRILIAELLLQRSRSSSVAKVYERLFAEWPTIQSLADAPIEEILQIIKPLGLPKRAEIIKSIAKEIIEKGDGIPKTAKELDCFYGIGEYISSATVACRKEVDYPLIDSVTARVYRRYFGIRPFSASTNKACLDKELKHIIGDKSPKNHIHEINWSVLDLAAKICLPKNPHCDDCPLKATCLYRKTLSDMTMVELFAGVGGFRIALEKSHWKTILSNQWEPGKKQQCASDIYVKRFGLNGHVCDDIEQVLNEIEEGNRSLPDFTLLVGGFPCQDYSVAKTLSQATGIRGKKGVLWWQIHRLVSMKKPPLLLLENVDRLLSSPSGQRGRDFAIMLACLSDLGYLVEWRVINAADYGFPQKRRRLFIVGRLPSEQLDFKNPIAWLIEKGTFAKAFPVKHKEQQPTLSSSGFVLPDITIEGDIKHVSDTFGKKTERSVFQNAGVMFNRNAWTRKVIPDFSGKYKTLGDILLDEEQIEESYFVPESQLDKWIYLKGAKKELRVHKASGFKYTYNEGGIPFPDDIDKPSRTILTGEGGATPSRFKHIILTPSGRYRRLTPIELERLNGFPDNWTCGVSDINRAFLMGNALVVGVVEKLGKVLADEFCFNQPV